MGKSGCGKSTLERGLCSDPGSFKKVISVTTRPQREGEVDGQDYFFVTNFEFDQLRHGDQMVQYTEFADNRYGSLRAEYTTDHPFVTLVVVPYSAATFAPVLKEKFEGINILNIYFDISDERLRANMRKRGDTEDMITKRLESDDLDKQFEEHGLVADLTITDDMLNESTTTHVLAWLQEKTGALYSG
jgi:guanylate kinase